MVMLAAYVVLRCRIGRVRGHPLPAAV